MSNKIFSIVTSKANGGFYKMDQSDDRYNHLYTKVGEIIEESKKRFSDYNGRKVNIVTTQDNQKFEVYSDWSARKI